MRASCAGSCALKRLDRSRAVKLVDDSGESNLKTGIGMPRFFGREGRTFVCCNVNKEHIPAG